MRDRLIELLGQARAMEASGIACKVKNEYIADHLLTNGVIVPPCKVEPIITVIRKPFHNRIEVVKNTRYEWNEAQFCFSESEADGVEARWKA